MPLQDILELIDREISQLQRARTLLAGETIVGEPIKRRGRPKGSTNKLQGPIAQIAKKAGMRTMSPEGKARIAAAQKARWANQKKAEATPRKVSAKATSAPTKKTSKPAGKKASAKRAVPARKNGAPAKSTSAGQPESSSAETSEA